MSWTGVLGGPDGCRVPLADPRRWPLMPVLVALSLLTLITACALACRHLDRKDPS